RIGGCQDVALLIVDEFGNGGRKLRPALLMPEMEGRSDLDFLAVDLRLGKGHQHFAQRVRLQKRTGLLQDRAGIEKPRRSHGQNLDQAPLLSGAVDGGLVGKAVRLLAAGTEGDRAYSRSLEAGAGQALE